MSPNSHGHLRPPWCLLVLGYRARRDPEARLGARAHFSALLVCVPPARVFAAARLALGPPGYVTSHPVGDLSPQSAGGAFRSETPSSEVAEARLPSFRKYLGGAVAPDRRGGGPAAGTGSVLSACSLVFPGGELRGTARLLSPSS